MTSPRFSAFRHDSAMITPRCFCHSIFALSLARFAYSHPRVMNFVHASRDRRLQNSPITKLCFVILNVVKNLYPRFLRSFLLSVVKMTGLDI